MTDTTLTAFGSTGLLVTPVCLGTSTWGPSRAGESAPDAIGRVAQIADAFFTGKLATNFLDTSNEYGTSLSEGVIGAAIERAGGIPDGVVLQTKLDRDPQTGEFTADRMWRSLDESRERLGIETFDVLYLHDPENIGFEASVAPGSTVDALVAMKEQGAARYIGISGGPVDMLQRFIATDLFDALITHNRFTLVDRSADALLTAATERGMGIANAAPYGAGVLTGDPRFAGSYGYAPIRPAMKEAVDHVARLCAEYGVTMAAAALQFSLRDPRVHSTIVGASTLSSIERALAEAEDPIPEELWTAFDEFLPAPGGLDDPR